MLYVACFHVVMFSCFHIARFSCFHVSIFLNLLKRYIRDAQANLPRQLGAVQGRLAAQLFLERPLKLLEALADVGLLSL